MSLEDDILALPRYSAIQIGVAGAVQRDTVLLSDVLACLKHVPQGQFTLYEITCETPKHFYVGVTLDVAHRFSQHQKRKGATFTQTHGAKSIKILGTFNDKWEAIKAESAHVAELNKQPGVVVAGAARADVEQQSSSLRPEAGLKVSSGDSRQDLASKAVLPPPEAP